MGICESSNHGKSLSSEIESKKPEVNQNEQAIDYNNINNNNVDTNNMGSMVQESKPNLKPELAQYDRSIYCSGKRSELTNTKTSIVSSGVSEQEIIIKGEINQEAKNKEEDFANTSFKRLVQKQGGIVLTESEYNNSNYGESRKPSFFDLGKENISEIHSKISIPNKKNDFYDNSSGISSIKMVNKNENYLTNINNKGNTNNNQNAGVINGKYDINGNFIPDQTNVQIENKNNVEKNNNNNNIAFLLGRHSNIKGSSKINISLHESCPGVDSFLNIPRIDQPLPDAEELSDSMDF